MTLVPYTGWLCIDCGAKHHVVISDDCDNHRLIRVLVDEPDFPPAADDDLAEAA